MPSWIGRLCFALLPFVCASAWGKTSKPLLLFEIDEGFSDGLLGQYRKDPAGIDRPLSKIESALTPLAAKYEVAVLVYPCQAYSMTEDGRGRVEPALRRLLSFFDRSKPHIGVFLEAYSSGIATEQDAAIDRRPTPYLGTGKSDRRRLGFSMDLRTFATLADEYPKTFRGIRFHEVYGSDIVWRVTPENGKRGFPFDEAVVRGCIDLCARKRLRLLWSDSNWLMKCPPDSDGPHYVYSPIERPYVDSEPYRSMQDEASAKLGALLCFSWANNNYHFTPNLGFLDAKVGASAPGVNRPLPSWLYFDMPYTAFPLEGRGRTQWGMSIQSWFWHELSYTLTGRYYHLGELACPIEILIAYARKGLREGASILQFEPGSYFFNESLPGAPEDTSSFERTADHSGRLALRRLERALMNPPGENVPDRLDAIFDRNQQRFHENDFAHPPRNFAQTSLISIDSARVPACFDRYSFSPAWRRNDANRFGAWVFTGVKPTACRLEADGDGVDELLVASRDASGRTQFRLFNPQSCAIGIDTSQMGDEELVGFASANLISDTVNGSDPDELVLAVRPNGSTSVRLMVVKIASASQKGVRYRLLPLSDQETRALIHGPVSFDSREFVGLVGLRQDACIYSDGSRSLDRLLVLQRGRSKLEAHPLNGAGKIVPLDVPSDAQCLSFCPLDERLTGDDSLFVAWAEKGRPSSATFQLTWAGIRKSAAPIGVPASTSVVALRKRILLNGGSAR